MVNQSIATFFLVLGFSPFFSAHAETIIAMGMSDQPGGHTLNKQLAHAGANDFLAEQTSVATFRYSKVDNKTVFEQWSKSDLRDVTITKSESYGKNGAIVWLSADVIIPSYPDEQCRKVTQSIRSDDQTNRLVAHILEKTIPGLLRPTLKKSTTVSGVSYLRNLSIEKTWLGAFRFKTDVCVAELNLL